MRKIWNKFFFTHDRKKIQDLLNEVFALVVNVEQKHKKISKQYDLLKSTVSSTIRNEQILYNMYGIYNILMKDERKMADLHSNMMMFLDILKIDKIFLMKIEKNSIKKKYQWQDGQKITNKYVNIEKTEAPELVDLIKKGDPFILDNIKYKNVEKFIKKYGIKGCCIYPVKINNSIWGILGFISYSYYKQWSSDEINICGLLSSFFSSSFTINYYRG